MMVQLPRDFFLHLVLDLPSLQNAMMETLAPLQTFVPLRRDALDLTETVIPPPMESIVGMKLLMTLALHAPANLLSLEDLVKPHQLLQLVRPPLHVRTKQNVIQEEDAMRLFPKLMDLFVEQGHPNAVTMHVLLVHVAHLPRLFLATLPVTNAIVLDLAISME